MSESFSHLYAYLVSGHLRHPVVKGGANVLRDDGAHGGGAASAAQPARRRREQAKQEAKEEEFVAGEFEILIFFINEHSDVRKI